MSILDRLPELEVTLRDYQESMLVGLDESKSKRTLMQLETGTGKTVIFMTYAILKAVLNGKRVLVIVGSEELLEQAINTAKFIKPDIDIGRFIGSHRDYDSQIVVASLQTLKNLHNLIILDDDFEIIIYDEAHHATSPMSKRSFYRYGVCDLDDAGHNNVELVTPHHSPTRELIGVTATPDRTDETPLGKIFHDRIDGPPIEWFISEGYLCDLKFMTVDTGIDLSDMRSYHGDFSESELAKKLIAAGYLNEISRVIEEYAEERKSILLYVPDVATAKIAAAAVQDSGIACDYVIGAERTRRSDVIKRFKSGDIRVLVNCLVLKEGFDAPNADCIILCRPTKSPLLLKQIIGRLTRIDEGKVNGLFIDCGFKRREDDIVSASGLFHQSHLQESEQEELSIKERINLQIKRAKVLHELIYLIDRIHHKIAVEQAQEAEMNAQAQNEQDKEFVYEDIPDQVKLLVDTRLLKKFGLMYTEFDMMFRERIAKIIQSNNSPFIYGESNPKQVETLSQMTDIPSEELSFMSWLEVQALTQVIRNQRVVTKRQKDYLDLLEYKGDPPKTERQASRLIGSLLTKSAGGTYTRGRA